MKTLLTTTIAFALGITLGYSQGGIVLQTTQALVSTNGSSIGEGTGAAAGNATYDYEVLDMTEEQYTALSAVQQAGLLSLNSGNLSLWTDSAVGGSSSTLHPGCIMGSAYAAGNTAVNWAAPKSFQDYSSAGSYDYYIVVGWSANEGTSWSTVASEIQNDDWAVTGAGSWFGITSVAYNYAGIVNGNPGSVSLWEGSTATGLAGSGGLTGLTLTPIDAATGSSADSTPVPTPEPASLALVALGGASLLLSRRNKK